MTDSWLEIDPDSDFSLDNLPIGIVSTPQDSTPHAAVAIGSFIVDLKVLFTHHNNDNLNNNLASIFPTLPDVAVAFSLPTLNAFAELGRSAHRELRTGLQTLLRSDTPHPSVLHDNQPLRQACIIPQTKVKMHLPMSIGDYTDFYAGYHHAHAVGSMFRGAAHALQPNYLHLPVGYHGRASSIVVSDTPIRRPVGQILLDPSKQEPTTGPSRKLDFELELGCFIGRGKELGGRVDVKEAESYIFGYVLLNDWSARDVQMWEYVPLGPFNGKNFGTTVSAWVVLADALEPFRARGVENEKAGELQGYLREERGESVFDIGLEVDLTTPEGNTTTICRTSSTNLVWSFPQMIAHHTLGGCPLRSGDLLGSGTISGPGGSEEAGSLLEMTLNGKKEVLLHGMDSRAFLKDGDTVTMRGVCKRSNGGRVGFGECRGRIYSAIL